MAKVRIDCTACGKRLKAPSPLPVGKRFRCPNCRYRVNLADVVSTRRHTAATVESEPDDVDVDDDELTATKEVASATLWTLISFFVVMLLGAIFMAIQVSGFSVSVFLVGSIGSAAILWRWWNSIRPAFVENSSNGSEINPVESLAYLFSVPQSRPASNSSKPKSEGSGCGCAFALLIVCGLVYLILFSGTHSTSTRPLWEIEVEKVAREYEAKEAARQ